LQELTSLGQKCNLSEMADSDALYRAIGKRLRDGRGRSAQKVSQAKLAKQLGISRASIVNIEAGRQHAPLDLLWRIAAALDMELVQLIPHRAELAASAAVVDLGSGMRRQIQLEAKGNPELQKSLTKVVGRLLTSIETDRKRG
jgi:transcriptional regulator with XRE-family HTH domain